MLGMYVLRMRTWSLELERITCCSGKLLGLSSLPTVLLTGIAWVGACKLSC